MTPQKDPNTRLRKSLIWTRYSTTNQSAQLQPPGRELTVSAIGLEFWWERREKFTFVNNDVYLFLYMSARGVFCINPYAIMMILVALIVTNDIDILLDSPDQDSLQPHGQCLQEHRLTLKVLLKQLIWLYHRYVYSWL